METYLEYLSQFHEKYFNLQWKLIEQAKPKAQNEMFMVLRIRNVCIEVKWHHHNCLDNM